MLHECVLGGNGRQSLNVHMSGLQGAHYHRDGPQPLGAVNKACIGPAWAGYHTWDALQISRSARMIVWKDDRNNPKPSQDADETASDAAWDPDQATDAAGPGSPDAASDDSMRAETASDAEWDPDQASVAASPDSADAGSNASGGAEASHPEPSEHTVWAVGLRLARCAP